MEASRALPAPAMESMTHLTLFLSGACVGAAAVALAAWRNQRRARRQKADDLARLAHDLRTPLSSVTAYAELIGDDDDPDARARFAGIILEEAGRMDAMIGANLARTGSQRPGAGPAAGAPAPAAATGNGRTVLVVDDDRFIVEGTRRLLARAGYAALGAAGGAEALDQARLRRPDLILMDLAMPEMGGLEALRRLRADPATRDIPVIVTTGDGEADRPEGASAVLSKPVSGEALLAAVSRTIRGGVSR